MYRKAAMLTYVIFFLFLVIVAGVFAVTVDGPWASIMFSVALALFLGLGFAYMRARYRRSRR
jgi:hypothetical protein